MKLKLLIATSDNDYAEHITNVLSEKHADTFDVRICSSAEHLSELLRDGKNKYFDVALLEPGFSSVADLSSIHLPLLLVDETGIIFDDIGLKKIRKYQRITTMVGDILQSFAEIGKGISAFSASRARITAVWSPMGGSGKTTVALAYAAQRVSRGKQAVYLNLENFSSTSSYFQENGKSISNAFGKLESNVQMFLAGIRQQDSGSGIFYFSGPENYDDMNILTANDIETLVIACAAGMDELVIDLSSQCNERTRKIFDLADTVLLVCDASSTSQAKIRQFINQHDVFGRIHQKAVLVNNKGAKAAETAINKTMQLPLVQSATPVSTFKTLSSGNFEW